MKPPVVGRLAGTVANRTGTVILALGGLMLAAHVASILIFPKPGGRIVFGDATHHFVQLRSIVFDRDLDFRNEYIRLYGLRGGEPDTEWVTTELTVTGHVRNYMPVGPALLDVPLTLLVAGAQSLLARAGLAQWPDGYERWFQAVHGNGPGPRGLLLHPRHAHRAGGGDRADGAADAHPGAQGTLRSPRRRRAQDAAALALRIGDRGGHLLDAV